MDDPDVLTQSLSVIPINCSIAFQYKFLVKTRVTPATWRTAYPLRYTLTHCYLHNIDWYHAKEENFDLLKAK